MATLNMIDRLTALEAVNRAQQPDAFLIIEALLQTNQILMDMPIIEANDGAIHTTVRRTSQPGGSHRVYNQGVNIKASQTKTIKDTIAMLEAYSVVDKAMAAHSGNTAALRNSEAVAFINGMGINQAFDLIYGNMAQDPAAIDGLAVRLNKLNGKTVVGMGGTGATNTSAYLVAAGPNFSHLIYPRGSSSIGVNRNDLGEQIWEDDEGKKFQALVEHFTAQYGLVSRHPEAVVRIANIGPSATGAAIVDQVLASYRRMPRGAANYILFANPDVLIKIDKEARDKVNVAHTAQDPWGREITMIRDIRCRQVDAILSTEATVA
jgi:hypothetical protein